MAADPVRRAVNGGHSGRGRDDQLVSVGCSTRYGRFVFKSPPRSKIPLRHLCFAEAPAQLFRRLGNFDRILADDGCLHHAIE